MQSTQTNWWEQWGSANNEQQDEESSLRLLVLLCEAITTAHTQGAWCNITLNGTRLCSHALGGMLEEVSPTQLIALLSNNDDVNTINNNHNNNKKSINFNWLHQLELINTYIGEESLLQLLPLMK